MNWITKEWIIEVMTWKREIDFNKFPRKDLIEMLNVLRLYLFERIIESGEDTE